jgi:AraC-like DNA-binding protein
VALSDGAFRRLCAARDRLREMDERSLTIDELAREAAVSPFHFIRQFHALFGTTPHQYRLDARIRRARELLASGRCSVTDACVEVGFTSLASFSHLFERRVGVRPAEYRRQTRPLFALGAPARRTLYAPGCFLLMAEAFATFDKSRH